ncbi:MAG TPA: thiamine-phosphate kinase [Dongiaceae bacterium]|nr:thiamine-phosphate kinase [Dongiaceae bacterium]
MTEFALIDAHFKALSQRVTGSRCDLGIGDDCALVTIPHGKQLAVTADTLVAGVHFPIATMPSDIGYKSLAVNLSDLAAMGARPAWYTLCVTVPQVTESWLQDFCAGLEALMREIPVTLIGGDTTRGPLSITIQAMGLVDSGCALQRNGAKPGDDIYVSGCIGDAGAGLRAVLGEIPVEQLAQIPILQSSLQRLNRPQPRCALGAALGAVASACIDVSDGLLADLGHVLNASGVGADLDLDLVPLSPALCDLAIVTQLEREAGALQGTLAGARRFALSAGDDYELCFTAPVSQRAQVAALAQQTGTPVTRIGSIQAQPGIRDLASGGALLAPSGYIHF